eukprot:sb/3464646/
MSFSNPNPAMPFCKAKRHPGGCLRHPPGQGNKNNDSKLHVYVSSDTGSIHNGSTKEDQVEFENAEEQLPEFRRQLLDFKDELNNVAEMYQQDYIDKVEKRSDLTMEARDKAVTCLVDVSKRIYNLAGCFQQLLDDQADKLSDIENKALTAATYLEKSTCCTFRADLHTRLPPANIPNRQPRIGRPPNITQPKGGEGKWEKLSYAKYDKITLVTGGADLGDDEFNEDFYDEMQHAAPININSASQLSLSSATSTTLNSPQIAPNNRLSASSVDIRQGSLSPAMNRCNSITSLTSVTSSKSLKLQPRRAAPAPPPGSRLTSGESRGRLHSVKNETGEGLHKPSVPAPRPPEDHYAVPPSYHPEEPIYDDVRSGGAPPAPPAPTAPLQYSTLSVQPEEDEEEEEFYTDMDCTLQPAPPSPVPPPPPPEEGRAASGPCRSVSLSISMQSLCR